jgi:hypothetical protein
MGRRATALLAGATINIAALLLPPWLPLDATGLALAALPWAALALALRLRSPRWTHAVYPASFVPLALARPELFGPERHAGPGGLLTVVVVVAAFAVFADSASHRSDRQVVPGSRLIQASASPLPGLARALGYCAIAVACAAIWLPLLSAPARPPVLALGVVGTLAVGVVAHEHLQVLASDATPTDARAAVVALRASLRAKANRIPLGVVLGLLTGLAGVAWYLRAGGVR